MSNPATYIFRGLRSASFKAFPCHWSRVRLQHNFRKRMYLRAPVPAGPGCLLEKVPRAVGAFAGAIEGLLPRESFPSFPARRAGTRETRLLS